MEASLDSADQRRLAYGVANLAQAMDLSPSTIRAAICRGELRATRINRRVLIRREDALAWLGGARKENR